jgi:hypothetical protein
MAIMSDQSELQYPESLYPNVSRLSDHVAAVPGRTVESASEDSASDEALF